MFYFKILFVPGRGRNPLKVVKLKNSDLHRGMTMRFCSLSSCSYANSVVVQDQNTCVLIDCGLRKRDILPFLQKVGLSPGDLDAVLVTHCHNDHIYGLKHLLKLRDLPVYSTAGVLRQLSRSYSFDRYPRFGVLEYGVEAAVGTLALTPLELSHDVETVGFAIEGDGERMGLLTDTGYVPEGCFDLLQQVDYLYIESNHDVEMYRRSAKPGYVIRRNLGPHGHLSNEQCGQALRAMDLAGCKLVLLGHLSEDDNEPHLALNCARKNLDPDIPLASAPSRVPGLWSDVYRMLKRRT